VVDGRQFALDTGYNLWNRSPASPRRPGAGAAAFEVDRDDVTSIHGILQSGTVTPFRRASQPWLSADVEPGDLGWIGDRLWQWL
jgi:hypothetical protein